MQVHGAIGYTWEADLQLWMKKAWALHARGRCHVPPASGGRGRPVTAHHGVPASKSVHMSLTSTHVRGRGPVTRPISSSAPSRPWCAPARSGSLISRASSTATSDSASRSSRRGSRRRRVRSWPRACNRVTGSASGRRTSPSGSSPRSACIGAGGVLVPLNTRFKGAEAAYVLAPSGAARAVHRERLPRHRLRRDAARRGRGAARRSSTIVVLRGDAPDGTHPVGRTSSAARRRWPSADAASARRRDRGRRPRATSSSRRARPGSRRA